MPTNFDALTDVDIQSKRISPIRVAQSRARTVTMSLMLPYTFDYVIRLCQACCMNAQECNRKYTYLSLLVFISAFHACKWPPRTADATEQPSYTGILFVCYCQGGACTSRIALSRRWPHTLTHCCSHFDEFQRLQNRQARRIKLTRPWITRVIVIRWCMHPGARGDTSSVCKSRVTQMAST